MPDIPDDTAADMEEQISQLCALEPDELKRAKGSSKLTGISLPAAKAMSIYLNLNRSLNKSSLIDNIILKRKRVAELADVHITEAEAEESDEESQKFISNQNTFPRLCNIILDYPDAVIRSAVLASKYALQNKETNQNQPIFVETCESFNSAEFNSGGLVTQHLELIKAKIDPEKNNKGKISAKQAIFIFFTSESPLLQPSPVIIFIRVITNHLVQN